MKSPEVATRYSLLARFPPREILTAGRTSGLGWLLIGACLFSPCLAQSSAPSPGNKQGNVQREEAEDYFKKWLEQDVVYIITPDEKAVFESLTTDLEKDMFIEQFWLRRDENPANPQNEFKQEHYRRIAHANERFASGYPGWLTDRGRIYILFGEPDQLESFAAGHTYDRSLSEGGGTTNTYPFQVWRYRHIAGIGEDIELEFVDRTLSGEYRLALDPNEKDALINLDSGGPMLLEQLDLARKADRGTTAGDLGYQRERDSQFMRFERYAKVLLPQEIEYTDLKQLVEVNTRFEQLPFTTRSDYIHLNENQVLALVSIQVSNRELDFKSENATLAGRIAVYGLISNLARRVISEFEDDLETRYPVASLELARQQSSLYQKAVPLDRKGRYKISLVVKDLHSEKIGTLEQVLEPPAHDPEQLTTSTPILADSIVSLKETDTDEMFVLGDLRVRPNLAREFRRINPIGLYFEVYNAGLDGASGRPDLKVTYQIQRDGETVFEATDEGGRSIHFFSVARVILVRPFSLKDLAPGNYRLHIQVWDRVSGRQVETADTFRVVE